MVNCKAVLVDIWRSLDTSERIARASLHQARMHKSLPTSHYLDGRVRTLQECKALIEGAHDAWLQAVAEERPETAK